MTDVTTTEGRRISGSANDWSRRRVAARLSIRGLAKRAGVPVSIVGLIDQGRLMPRADEAAKILRALDEAEAGR